MGEKKKLTFNIAYYLFGGKKVPVVENSSN